MGNCYVFDLDGTLADIEHRLHFIQGETQDWRGFFAACGDDTVIEPVSRLLRHLAGVSNIVILSGRSDECRGATKAWLHKHELVYDMLYMRKEGDHRPDHEIKLEMLDQMKNDGYEPILFVDDRSKTVVDMWRAQGFICLQCQPGEF